jgi:hypothetical protein
MFCGFGGVCGINDWSSLRHCVVPIEIDSLKKRKDFKMLRKTLVSAICLTVFAASTGFAVDATSDGVIHSSKKFGIKSAAITMKMDMSPGASASAGVPAMASSGTITMLFDDFGNKESIYNETAMEMMGMKINAKSQTIITDGMVYVIDFDKKSATKSKILKVDDPTKIDWANTTADYIKRWNIRKEGTAVVAGKTCDVYSFKTDDIHAASGDTKSKQKIPMSGTCCVWKNIGLKADFVLNGSMSVKLEATKVDENAAITASMFEVPADIKIKE